MKKKHYLHKYVHLLSGRAQPLLPIFIIGILFLGTVASVIHTSPFGNSPEAKFTDASATGLAIVPASGGSTPTLEPYGYLDSEGCEPNGVHGWAASQLSPSRSINVKFYIDGQYIAETSTNVLREDVNAAFNLTGNHGFEWTIPAAYFDNQSHTIAAYGVDNGATKKLTNDSGPGFASVETFTCDDSLSQTISAQYPTIQVGQTDVIHGTYTAGSAHPLTATSINEIPPNTVNSGTEFIVKGSGVFSGSANIPVTTPLDYVFTPTTPGTYTFLPYAQTTNVTSPKTIDSSQWATVVVTANTGTCPDGTNAPGGDPNQCTCAHGNTSQCVCPSGSTCTQCTSGSGSTCQCPAGYVLQNGMCIFTQCPTGYTLDAQGQCVPPTQSCTPHYLCGPDGNLYHQDNQCNVTTNPVWTCSYGCEGNACKAPPPPQVVTFKVSPTLVHSGNSTKVTWEVLHAVNCSVVGTNGDGGASWDGLSGSQNSSGIVGQTVFTLHCSVISGAQNPDGSPAIWTDQHATVNVIPSWQNI